MAICALYVKRTIHIPFSSIEKIVVGNYVEYIQIPKGVNFYRVQALMIIHHDQGMFFRHFSSRDEFANWVQRFTDKNIALYKTEYDLCPAYTDRLKYDIDFAKLEGYPWNEKISTPPIGRETVKNPYEPWEHDGKLKEEFVDNQKRHTIKWINRINLILFIYAIIVGSIIIPTRMIGDDGLIEIDFVVIFGVSFVYILLPALFLYGRKYAKWYLPLIHFFITFIGGMIGVYLSSLFNELPPLYSSILALNIFNIIIGWVPAYLFMRLFWRYLAI